MFGVIITTASLMGVWGLSRVEGRYVNLADNVFHITPQEKNPIGLNLAT
jgi:hypothetical protein